jgi:hypothetical protein
MSLGPPAESSEGAGLHYAANGNFDSRGLFLPGSVGFNLADVSSPAQLDRLPIGVRGLVWVGQCSGADPAFVAKVGAFKEKSNLWGFYLMDDPDPRGIGGCKSEQLLAEADWIHQNVPGAKTFVVLMNLGSSKNPTFSDSYSPENTHIDLFGFSPYPCRTELHECDLDMVDRYVAAARSSGIAPEQMVPVYQVFGGGEWYDDVGGRFVMPTPAEETQLLARWNALLPHPVFDVAYSWGVQRGDMALQNAPDLQAVFAWHNNHKNLD